MYSPNATRCSGIYSNNHLTIPIIIFNFELLSIDCIMEKDIKDYKNVLVIGNGFDLNLGLNTSYSSFLKSSQFKSLINNHLAIFLRECQRKSRWIDIEKELYNYSKSLFVSTSSGVLKPDYGKKVNIKNFRQDFESICKSLSSYLCEIVRDTISFDENTEAYKIIQNTLEDNGNTYILTFNYTRMIEKIINIYFYSNNNYSINHIHGCLPNNIVFGIEDSVEIAKEHVFLYKSHNQNQNINGLINILNNADNVIFFGYSLGETDHSYFDDFFRVQTLPDCKSKSFTFYYHGQEAYDDLIWQLKTLTKNRLSYLKQYNIIRFIKC